MDEKNVKKEKETKIDRQIKKNYRFFIGIGILILVFVIFFFAFRDIGKIKYEGLTFTKERFGEVLLYSYNYLVKTPSGQVATRVLYLRGNPSKNNVSIEGEIIYPEGKTVYISINSTGFNECEDSMIALASLTGFFVNNNLKVKAGTPDKEEAKMSNSTYISCDNRKENTVVAIRSGKETKIIKSGQLCYNVNFANCEILPALEKFIVQSLLDARKNLEN